MTEIKSLFDKKLKIINVGIETFADDLRKQGLEVIQLDWSPPAGGDLEMLKLLDKLKS